MRTLALNVLLCLAVTPVWAQEVAGRVGGRVLSTDSAPLADVEVSVSGPNLMGTRSTVTDRAGRFLLLALPVGVYRVQARRVGFRPVAVQGVPVRLGATADLPRVLLEPQAPIELAELVITAEAAGLDPTSAADRTTLDIGALDALPLERNFREVVLLAPQSVPSFIGDGINVAGATGFENNYYVDGINITSPINGRTSMDLPYNFIQQVEVRTGGATAEDPQALGGVVNVVTPSGGNELRGSVFGFWSGDAVRTAAQPVAGASQTGFAFYDAAISLSGPVIRDRLWFFTAFDRNYERRDHTYGFGTLSDIRRQNLFAGKLSWRPGPRTFATFTVLGDPSRLEPVTTPPFAAGVAQNREVLEETGRAGGVGVSLHAQHVVSPRALVEVSVSQMTRLESGDPATAGARAPYVIDVLAGTLYGGRGFGYRYDSRRRSIRADVTWQPARHTVKAGIVYEELRNTMMQCAARSTCGGDITRSDTALYSWHFAGMGNGQAKLRNRGVYLQDAWQITPRLVASGGVRWSRQDMLNGFADTLTFRIHDGLQPRVGLVYQVGAVGTQRVFVSWGRVADQVGLWNGIEFAPGAESLMTFPQDPRADTSGGVLVYAIPFGSGYASDPRIRGQTSDEWTVGYGRRVGRTLTLSVRAVRRSLRDAVSNGADTTFTFVWGNPGRGRLSQFPRPTRTHDALELTLLHAGVGSTWYQLSYVLSRTRGNFPGIYLSDWGFRDVPSEFSPLYVFASQWRNASGLLPNDRTHLFKAYGGHRFQLGLDVGASLLVASGTPRTDYGAIPEAPGPFFGIASPRGSAGRTPTIWDLGIRAAYDIPVARRGAVRSRVLLDLLHVGSPRAAVAHDQQRYTCLDANGNQSCPNASYGAVTQYQPPMTGRLGFAVAF